MPPRLLALRAGFGWLGPRAPRLATQLAERIFRTPPPRRVRAHERDALAFADEVRVSFGTETIPTWSFGEGPTVVLVHGWGGRGMQLRSFIDPLVSRGFRVVLFDAPGHGASETALSSLPEVAGATRAVLDAVGPAHAVIAHSMGGPATLLAIEAGARVDNVVLIAPPTDMRNVTRKFASFLHLPEEVRVGVERSLERRFLTRLADLDALPIARKATAPLLVVHDRLDDDVPYAEGEALVRAWSGPSQLMTTEGLGHNRVLRDRRVVETVARFVDDARFRTVA